MLAEYLLYVSFVANGEDLSADGRQMPWTHSGRNLASSSTMGHIRFLHGGSLGTIHLLCSGFHASPLTGNSLSNGTQCGQIIGLIINGYVSERFGYRWTVIVCIGLIAAWTAIYFTADKIWHILIAGILSGVPWGVFQTLTISYASSVVLRRTLVTI